jgi:putative transposase
LRTHSRLKISQWEPSSKNCHVCGYHNSELTLKDREWLCPEYYTMHDRDINAAISIKKFAISTYQITTGTAVKFVESLAMVKAMKQEASQL